MAAAEIDSERKLLACFRRRKRETQCNRFYVSLQKAICSQLKLNLTRACPITKLSFPNAVRAHSDKKRIVHRELAVMEHEAFRKEDTGGHSATAQLTKHTVVRASCVSRQAGMGTVYKLYNKALGHNHALAKYALYGSHSVLQTLSIYLHPYPHRVIYHSRTVPFLSYKKVTFLVQTLKT